MSNDGYLECGIIVEDVDTDETEVVLHIHLKDKDLIVFHNVLNDPVFYKGWLNVEHKLFSTTMTSIVRESDVKYLSYYTIPKEEKK